MTKRLFCDINHFFFKAELTNKLREIQKLISGEPPKEYKLLKANSHTSNEMIQREFETASEEFYQTYLRVCRVTK